MIIGESNITICFRTAFTLKDSLLKAGFKGKETKKYPFAQHTLAIYTHIYIGLYIYTWLKEMVCDLQLSPECWEL